MHRVIHHSYNGGERALRSCHLLWRWLSHADAEASFPAPSARIYISYRVPRFFQRRTAADSTQYLLGSRHCNDDQHPSKATHTWEEAKGERCLPFRPVLSGSTCASLTLPSSMTKAYRLLRGPPKMALPSKDRSRALVNWRPGSARKRIWSGTLSGCGGCQGCTHSALARWVEDLAPGFHAGYGMSVSGDGST